MVHKVVPARGNILEKWLPARYILAVLGCMGMGIVYGLKVNLSVAIVSMVNHSAIELLSKDEHISNGNQELKTSIQDDCSENGNSSGVVEDGPFLWTGYVQGPMLSSYFWGYILAQFPGGYIAESISAKWVMFFSVAINVICTLLTPLTAKLHYGAMIAMRIGEGIGGGVTFPAMHVMLAHWAPPSERSTMSSITYAGTALGTVFSLLLSGVFASQWGWESIFYIMGGSAVIWMFLWTVLISDNPETQSFISQKERDFIINSLKEDGEDNLGEKHRFPFKAVLKSMPFYAILVAHTCGNWGWYMVLIELPQYMRMVLKFKIAENAILTALPFFVMWIFSLVLSRTLDSLRAKGMISTTIARKTATLISSVVPLVCLLALCYIGCMRILAVALMTIAIAGCGGFFCGYLANHIDIAPNFAGTLMAITNTFATIPGIVLPIFVGNLTHDDPSINSWRIIFWVTIALYAILIVFYTLFASGEVQPWNKGHISAVPEEEPLKITDRNYEAVSHSIFETT